MSEFAQHKKDVRKALGSLVQHKGKGLPDLDTLLEVLPKLLEDIEERTPNSELEELRGRLNDRAREYRFAAAELEGSGEEHKRSATMLEGIAKGLGHAASWLDELIVPF